MDYEVVLGPCKNMSLVVELVPRPSFVYTKG
jgi:hypothetical protein